jgi:hypothetical protein
MESRRLNALINLRDSEATGASRESAKGVNQRANREQALRGRIGGYAKASRYPKGELTRAAREQFLAKFEKEVDPEGLLPPEERQRRAKAALRAHMARLAGKSATARRRRPGDCQPQQLEVHEKVCPHV